MLRNRRKTGPIGIDIGTTSIKMLQFADDEDAPRIVAAAHCDLPAASEGDADPASAAYRAVSDSLRCNPFVGRRVVTAFGNGDFQIKNIRLPRMPADELAGAVEFEARERFDVPGGPLQFRFGSASEVRHGNEMKEEIIVFGVSEEIIAKRLSFMESLKLEVAAIDITPCGVARSFVRFLRRFDDLSVVNVFLEIGWSCTTVVITRGTEIAFVKQIEIGGKHMTAAVSEALGVSVLEAGRLRLRIIRQTGGRRNGDAAPVHEELRNTVADAVRPSVERMCREIQLCLRYFAVTFRGQRPESITFVGGDAHEPVLMAILGENIDIPCTIGHPLRGVHQADLIGGPDRRTFQPAWAVAAGLALRDSKWVEPRAAQRGTLETAGQSLAGDRRA